MKSLSSEVGEIEKREALKRVLASNAFHRTGQLKSLLKYVCEREIEGTGDCLDECTVAVEALGRASSYSPFEDGTVRNRIHNLRRRLEQYYAVDNPDDPIHIVMPKGTYCPVFKYGVVVLRTLPEVKPDAISLPQPAPEFWARPVPLRWACVVCLVAATVVCGLTIGIGGKLNSGRYGLDQ